ncbi:unnamed protein product, partial [Didymodactylos carnosus]
VDMQHKTKKSALFVENQENTSTPTSPHQRQNIQLSTVNKNNLSIRPPSGSKMISDPLSDISNSFNANIDLFNDPDNDTNYSDNQLTNEENISPLSQQPEKQCGFAIPVDK